MKGNNDQGSFTTAVEQCDMRSGSLIVPLRQAQCDNKRTPQPIALDNSHPINSSKKKKQLREINPRYKASPH
jgi:hypothetical protein